jgi:hypothetical protein
MDNDRRRLLLRLVFGASAITAVADSGAAAATQLDETDPAAIALGYRANAKLVDRKKFPSYEVHQSCVNCALFAFGTGIQRPCSLFPGKLVYSGGWCKAWAKKRK